MVRGGADDDLRDVVEVQWHRQWRVVDDILLGRHDCLLPNRTAISGQARWLIHLA